MGCSLSRSSDRIRKINIQIQDQKTFLNELDHNGIISVIQEQYNIIEVQGRAYLLYWKAQVLNIFDPQTYNKYQFLLHGDIQNVTGWTKCILILTNQFLYKMQIFDEKMKIVRQIQFKLHNQAQKVSVLFYSRDFILVRYQQPYVYLIKLGVFNIFKKIFKIYIDYHYRDFMQYDSQNGALIFGASYPQLKLLDIKSKQLRIVKLRCPSLSDRILIKYVKIVENNIDVLFLVNKEKGLFLNKINYDNGLIETFKFLYYHVRDFNIFENYNSLVLLTTYTYLKFDKDYNVQQKFETHFDCVNGFRDYLKEIAIRRYCKSYLFLIYQKIIPQTQNQEREIRIYKQDQHLNTGILWIREIKNYEVEKRNQMKAQISQNQNYLATLKDSQLLLFYIIESKIEMQYFFCEAVNYLTFSFDSRQLCIACENRITYFRCQKNGLKQRNYLFISNCEQLIFGRNGINVSKDSKDRIRVISQNAKKLIFRLNKFYKILNIKLDYCPFSGIIMISKPQILLIVIYQLPDRKQIKLNIKKNNCQLIEKTRQLIISRQGGHLELVSLDTQYGIVSQRFILKNICLILQGSANSYYFQDLKQRILVLDQNLTLREKIKNENIYWKPLQIMENFILYETTYGISLNPRT